MIDESDEFLKRIAKLEHTFKDAIDHFNHWINSVERKIVKLKEEIKLFRTNERINMTRWVDVKEWCPGDAISVLIAYILLDINKNMYCGIGYYCKNEKDETQGTWFLAEPLSNNSFSYDHDEQIEVLYWTLLPDLPIRPYAIEKGYLPGCCL